ncbi:malate:quinone oxidoreductase [Candidatus Methylopumilus planktonicus]|uniref:malate:quinone oxidoreductase n=1 Tax=Candidatus Methylopumilus planktonicus TaxID=1581557 RepID=UPI001121259E|nr:malate:quinone oxidoreductase [Candidatus Methylopumilus planktonicus]QDD10889.1 malate:quinone oxidoreductase [Candidatus Methylopumilus planktonicus]QDD23359.1 malate:quinone oxidoreductase [Candidatus Methylopumilus planktonicus]
MKKTDCILIGGGIMSITLAKLLQEIDSSINVTIYEKLSSCALESTQSINNAGTGHAGFCELNYTNFDNHNEVNIDKARKINGEFEVSLQFWSFLARKYKSFKPKSFITQVPHISFVKGDKNISFLKKRYEALTKTLPFKEMQFSRRRETIKQWAPLVAEDFKDNIAMTRVDLGSDIDFESLSVQMLKILSTSKNFSLHTHHEVKAMSQKNDKTWDIKIYNSKNKATILINANFIFIGAGGSSIQLLQKSNIKNQIGYACFPINGEWLICKKSSITKKHFSKVYGLAGPKAPPMSAPHLDLRIINGKRQLMFGPFASFTFKFLKTGSYLDLLKSIRIHNILPMLHVFICNLNLLIYLIKESASSYKDKMNALKEFYPLANEKDWKLASAGKRVQIIKPYKKIGGKLEFGTEVVWSDDSSLAALLGASPGASTSVYSMLNVIEKSFKGSINSKVWKNKIEKMVPSYNQDLSKQPSLFNKTRRSTYKTLGFKI